MHGAFPILVLATAPFLLFSRCIWNRTLFLICSIALIAGSYAAYCSIFVWPKYADIENGRADYPFLSLGAPLWGIPLYVILIPVLLQFLIPILTAFYCVRKKFRYWQFAAGGAAGICMMRAATLGVRWWARQGYPAPIKESWLPPNGILILLFVFLLILLPLQRRALESLLGFPLTKRGTRIETHASSFGTALLGHAALLGVSALFAVMLVYQYLECRVDMTMKYGPERQAVNPALRNAFDDWKPYFTRGKSAIIKLGAAPTSNLPTQKSGSYGRAGQSAPSANQRSFIYLGVTIPLTLDCYQETTTPAILKARIEAIEPKELEKLFKGYAENLAALERARQADYCRFQETSQSLMQNALHSYFREIARVLNLRALEHVVYGRSNEALRDIETIWNTGCLLAESNDSLIACMIGISIRRIGLDAAYNYFLYYREDMRALEALEALMAKWRWRVCRPLDWDAIRHVEFGLWKVCLFPEINMPGTIRATAVNYAQWARYDTLYMAIALEKYRQAQGGYPASLKELVPRYLDKERVDPFVGQPYAYERTPEGFCLSCPYLENMTWLGDGPHLRYSCHIEVIGGDWRIGACNDEAGKTKK
ncbi:MAG: hypothetical protein NTX50_06310 [Candidatus Sumerlaeota bacterium]|nr:hypothetical protein [Candidatus Sumerlaeota bacterium]